MRPAPGAERVLYSASGGSGGAEPTWAWRSKSAGAWPRTASGAACAAGGVSAAPKWGSLPRRVAASRGRWLWRRASAPRSRARARRRRARARLAAGPCRASGSRLPQVVGRAPRRSRRARPARVERGSVRRAAGGVRRRPVLHHRARARGRFCAAGAAGSGRGRRWRGRGRRRGRGGREGVARARSAESGGTADHPSKSGARRGVTSPLAARDLVGGRRRA